jgi:hypothetical protein
LLIDFSLFAIVIVSESVLATWIYNSTSQSVLATIVFHHSIHLASVIPVIPGVVGTLIFALVPRLQLLPPYWQVAHR